ncbi:MAG TPA: tetratricopeptide repeat protein [Candidatus Obscuribacterales bacterium]
MTKDARRSLAALFCLSAALLPCQPGAIAQGTGGNTTLKGRIERDVAMADQLLQKGRYADAVDLYRQALKRNRRNVGVLVGLGTALARQFKLDGAEEQFDKALAIDPKNALARSGKATVLLNRLQSSSATILRNKDLILAQAEEECKKAIALDPNLAEPHLTLGLVYKDQGRLTEAAGELEAAAKLDPKSTEALVSLGLVRMALGELDKALENFKQAIALNPGNSTAHYGLGRVYLKQGQLDEAIRELNTSLYQYPNSAPAREALGAAYELQGNTVAAIKEYQESIRIKPENPLAYVRIAQIRQNRGDLEHSIAELRSGLELMPDNPELHMWVANQSLQLGKIDDAIREYGTVLSLDKGSKEAARGLARAYTMQASRQAAAAFLMSNEFEKAERMVEQALQLYPDDLELRLAQAKLKILAGKPVNLDALGNPQTDGERVAYAEALLAQNRFKEATEQMNTVIASATKAKQLVSVADLAFAIRDLDSAEAAYRKALSLPGAEERARRGLAAVAGARRSAEQAVRAGDDLAWQKQYGSAVDQYRAAIYENPRLAAARLGLAKVLEKLGTACERDLRSALKQYRAYLDLEPDLPAKQRAKLTKRMEQLDQRARKLAHKDRQRAGR